MSCTEESKSRYDGLTHKAKKVLLISMREKAEEALIEFRNCPSGMFCLVRELKTNDEEVEGGRCMSGSDGKLYFSEKEKR